MSYLLFWSVCLGFVLTMLCHVCPVSVGVPYSDPLTIPLSIRKELEANRVILDTVIHDEEQWSQNMEEYIRGLPKPGSMSESSQILIQFKQWCENQWVSVTHFKTVTDDIQKGIRKCRYLRLVNTPGGRQRLSKINLLAF